MQVVFMGTPDFAVPALKALIESGHDLAAVVTQPDRPKGRGKKELPPPVKETARASGIPVFQPTKIKDPDFLALLKGLSPEIIVVSAFGRILPPDILFLPRYGCINVHASLLPKYRGAAPIHWAVINGETETGITTMHMDIGLDTGDMILQEAITIDSDENVGSVHDRLAVLGASLLLETLDLLSLGKAPRIPQAGAGTYAPMLKAEDELISWKKPVRSLHNQIRGMDPWPGARTFLSGRVLKIWRSVVADEEQAVQPGRVLSGGTGGIMVGTGKGLLLITELQLQGAKRLKAADFLRGTPIPEGTVFGGTSG